MCFIIMMLCVDCCNFFLKFVLFVPAEHDILKFRVTIWGLCAIASSKEMYEYSSNEYCHRVGPFAWLSMYTVAVEMMTVIKFSEGRFTEPFPWYVKAIFGSVAVAITIGAYIAYRNEQLEK